MNIQEDIYAVFRVCKKVFQEKPDLHFHFAGDLRQCQLFVYEKMGVRFNLNSPFRIFKLVDVTNPEEESELDQFKKHFQKESFCETCLR